MRFIQQLVMLLVALVASVSALDQNLTRQVFTIFDDVDPDAGKNVIEIVQTRGYEIEEHKVTTSDGYILTMYRLPKTYVESQSNSDAAAGKPVVILQHGLLDSSFTFVSNYRDQSLAYILADAGYDVWLGNNRGTTWSKEHTTLSIDSDEYWDFTWNEMGVFDVPAFINRALSQSGQSTLSWVGHSEGTTQAFVAFSENQELAQRVSYFGALAPIGNIGHAKSPVFVVLAETYVDKLFQILGVDEFLPHTTLLNELILENGCAWQDFACDSLLNLICGPSDNMNQSRIHVYMTQTPAGTSVKNMVHYAQSIRKNTFKKYDYGCNCQTWLPIALCPNAFCKNKEVYGDFTPPDYDLAGMAYPRMGWFTGNQDWFASKVDLDWMRARIPDDTIVTDIPYELNHLDFTWAYQLKDSVYADLMNDLEKYSGKGY